MKNLILKHIGHSVQLTPMRTITILLGCMLTWQVTPQLLTAADPTVGLLDAGIWQLLLFATICFFGTIALCILVFKGMLAGIGLPPISKILSQSNQLTLWQQYLLYFALFALLLSSATGCLIAIF